ncbi:hypothetical protein UlMin_003511 [Ulmus minor]
MLIRVSSSILLLYLVSLTLLYFFKTFKPSGFSLKLIPRHSSESPFFPGKLSEKKRIQTMVEFSKSRANHIASSSSSSSGEEETTTTTMNLQLQKHGIFYTVHVYIGTPKTKQTLLMDTGSGLVWTRCKPCSNCFNQTDQIFNPNTSTTYKKLPCHHPLCRNRYRCVGGECVYSQRYAGGSSTKGVISSDNLLFPLKNGSFKLVKDVIFGCSNDNQNLFSGILGLSSSPESLASQLGKRNPSNKRFSYCLPSHDTPVSTVLRFGKDILNPHPNPHKTQFLTQNRTTHHYYLNLTDISVSGHRLNFEPGTFSIKNDGSGGCVIDSGSVSSYLDEKPYRAVIKEFEKFYRRFGFERLRNLSLGLEVCYREKLEFVGDYAGLTFHFDSADLVVEPEYVYVFNRRERYFCVALLSFNGKTIIGAWQQQNMRFIYDLNLGELNFAKDDCSKDQL